MSSKHLVHNNNDDEEDMEAAAAAVRRCDPKQKGHFVFVEEHSFCVPVFDCEGPHLKHLMLARDVAACVGSPAAAMTVLRTLRKTFINRAMLNVDGVAAAECVLGVIQGICHYATPEVVEELVRSSILVSFKVSAAFLPESEVLHTDMCLKLVTAAKDAPVFRALMQQLEPMLIHLSRSSINSDTLCRICECAATPSVLDVVCNRVMEQTDVITPEISVCLFGACDRCRHYDFAHYIVDNAEMFVDVCSGRFLLDAIRLVAAMAELPLPEKVPLATLQLLAKSDVAERWPEVRCCLEPSLAMLERAVTAVASRSHEASSGTVQAAVICALVASDIKHAVVEGELQHNVLRMISWAASRGFGPPHEVVHLLSKWSQGTPQQFSAVCDMLVSSPVLCGFLSEMTSQDAAMLLELDVA